ncbi:GspE/PulE family protein [Burkholderia cepacia]|uniref:Type II secretion protein ATPase n=2 Tax=Burkholderia cepacia TaxID=292 RepID=A0AAX2RRX0_BURCE|nr:ATPase, T2SS/T4P/T4SS family [Burkholderia cepacia]TET01710.1 type II secretion protein ATPase [Burkholderia cepacia]TEU47568.1 type II secretion protein ATPase [Burkholderia cepacia]TEU53440.1 type II secretion protein ATPase [Burkholderia cepacia]TEV02201.1 type II secretion protein ATPase [Burkholderia cepacia]TEV07857.1 type II secretion protein ATPase [Burkholderia cepacia]
MGFLSRFVQDSAGSAAPRSSQRVEPTARKAAPVRGIKPQGARPGTAVPNGYANGEAVTSVRRVDSVRAPGFITDADELPSFTRKLYEEVGLQPSFRHQVCPIEMSGDKDGKRQYAFIVLENMVESDIAEAVGKNLLRNQYSPASPLYYVASQEILVELCRDTVMENRQRSKGAKSTLTRAQRSALWSQFESIVKFAIGNNASDIHLEIDRTSPVSQVEFAIDGKLTKPRQFSLKTLDMLDMAAYLYNIHGKAGSETAFNENKPQACNISATVSGRRLMFRYASLQSAVGTSITLRMLYQDDKQTVRPLENLGYLPSQVALWKRCLLRTGGGIVIAGVVGSGKSTTMQTVMSMLPSWMKKYTVEDPVEYRIPGTVQFNVSRALDDKETDPFIAVKRQIKRKALDAALVGEVRDSESAGLFRDIAESGHRALTTVHAPSAIDIITIRLTSDELGIPRDVIATPGFLNVLVYQALLPLSCSCKVSSRDAVEKGIIDSKYLDQIKRIFDIDVDGVYFRNSSGCPRCIRDGLPELNGARDRTVVAEMIELDSKMLMMFRAGRHLELKQYVRSLNRSRFDEPDTTGKSVLEIAMYKVSQGLIDPREVEAKFGSFYQYERERDMDAMLADQAHRHTGQRTRPVRRPLSSFARRSFATRTSRSN